MTDGAGFDIGLMILILSLGFSTRVQDRPRELDDDWHRWEETTNESYQQGYRGRAGEARGASSIRSLAAMLSLTTNGEAVFHNGNQGVTMPQWLGNNEGTSKLMRGQ